MTGRWTLGQPVCDLWITSDVFCCTASILNIVVIALDRYWLITRNVRYTHSTLLPRRSICAALLAGAWLAAALIAAAPLLGWRAGTERQDPDTCLISQDYAYTIFSTFGAFWFPLSVILIVYAKIFVFARRRATRRAAAKASATVAASTAAAVASTAARQRRSAAAAAARENAAAAAVADNGIAVTRTSVNVLQLPPVTYGVESSVANVQTTGSRPSDASAVNADLSDLGDAVRCRDNVPAADALGPDLGDAARCRDNAAAGANTRKCRRASDVSVYNADVSETGDQDSAPAAAAAAAAAPGSRKCRRGARRVRRSARTLGLIIGGFVVCWLPFFVVATTMPFCPDCDVPATVSSVVLWLGYSNSLLNPAIYAIWDRAFRRAFRRLGTCDFRS